MASSRRLLARLRALMAAGSGQGDGVAFDELTTLVAAEMVAEVCAIYAMRPGDLLELVATHGLNQEAVGRTRLRVGEGIVGSTDRTLDVVGAAGGDAADHAPSGRIADLEYGSAQRLGPAGDEGAEIDGGLGCAHGSSLGFDIETDNEG